MYCKNCGNKVIENAKFCKNCGKGVTEQETKISSETTSPFKKNYLFWLFSMLAFYVALVLRENSYISDNLCILIIGICALVGIISFVILLRAIISHSSSKNRSKYIALIIATIVLFFVSLRIEAPIFNNTYSQNEAGLRKTAEKQYELNNQGEAGLREIYKNYLSSSFKNSTTEDKYVSGIVTNDQSEGIQGNKFDIHAIYLNGAEGYVDRTIYFCADTSCAN